jgi:hypothetical protein
VRMGVGEVGFGRYGKKNDPLVRSGEAGNASGCYHMGEHRQKRYSVQAFCDFHHGLYISVP